MALLFLFSCSRAEPKIAYGIIRLVYYQEERGVTERYSFFVIPEDDDGIEDIEDLYLFHDKEGLRWHLSSSDWISLQHEDQTWIGSRSISMLDDASLPRGQFRAVLADKAGERSERTFTFDAPSSPRFAFPVLTISGGAYGVESRYPENKFIVFNGQGAYMTTVSLNNLHGRISDLSLPSDAASLALWAEDSEYSTAALTDIIPLSR